MEVPMPRPTLPRPTRAFRRAALALAVLAAAILLPGPAAAQETKPLPARLLDSVVAIEVAVPAEARSARNLGTRREGSGVVIDDEGLVLTIGYLVMEADSIIVSTGPGRRVPASLIAYDHDTGLGLIRTAIPPGVKAMPLGESAKLAVKQPVLVVPAGGPELVLGAYVVDRRDFAGYWEYLLPGAIFTSPPHQQFGGAALIDPDGALVGIGSLIVPDALRAQSNIWPGNMFIPIDALKPILGDLIANGRSSKPPRPWLGVTTQEIEGRLLVRAVPEGSPAWKAGVRPGDLILGVKGEPAGDLAGFYRKVWALGAPGVDVPLLIQRGTQPLEITVRSMDRYKWLKLNPTY
jgi:S1-C subfamily serine protease